MNIFHKISNQYIFITTQFIIQFTCYKLVSFSRVPFALVRKLYFSSTIHAIACLACSRVSPMKSDVSLQNATENFFFTDNIISSTTSLLPQLPDVYVCVRLCLLNR